MRRLTRAQRIAVAIWLVVPIVVGNAIYDLLLTRGVQEYLFRVALHEAGRGPLVSMGDVMGRVVYDATWVGLLFGCLVALAGFATIRLLSGAPPRHDESAAPGART